MAPNTVQGFKNLRPNPFNSDNFPGVSASPEQSFNSFPKEHTKYFSADDIIVLLNSSGKDVFLILHLNIRSLSKNFENLKTNSNYLPHRILVFA